MGPSCPRTGGANPAQHGSSAYARLVGVQLDMNCQPNISDEPESAEYLRIAKIFKGEAALLCEVRPAACRPAVKAAPTARAAPPAQSLCLAARP